MLYKSRQPNMPLIRSERQLVDLLNMFRVISIEQMHRYLVLKKHPAGHDRKSVIAHIVELATTYHFSYFQEIGKIAMLRTDLDIPGVLQPFWVYLDFLALNEAGGVSKTNIPYTPIVFEQPSGDHLLEIVLIPKGENLQNVNYELFLYDEQMQKDEWRQRIVIVPTADSISVLRIQHVFMYAVVNDDGTVEYYDS